MTFTEFGPNSGARVPEHNRLRGLDQGDPHPQYANSDHTHDEPRGVLGHAMVEADQTGISGTTDLIGLSRTVTVDPGRRIRVTVRYLAQQNVAGLGIIVARIQEDSTELARYQATVPGDYYEQVSIKAIEAPTAGLHTYKATLATTAATVALLAGAGYPGFLLVEDIGAA